MTAQTDIIAFLRNHKPFLQERYGFHRIILFGSFARGTQSDTSDVDIAVLADKQHKTLRTVLDAKTYLSHAFNRSIDLVFMDSMNPVIQKDMEKEMIEIE